MTGKTRFKKLKKNEQNPLDSNVSLEGGTGYFEIPANASKYFRQALDESRTASVAPVGSITISLLESVLHTNNELNQRVKNIISVSEMIKSDSRKYVNKNSENSTSKLGHFRKARNKMNTKKYSEKFANAMSYLIGLEEKQHEQELITIQNAILARKK